MDEIRILISGSGRMGQEVLTGVTAAAGLTPVGILEGLGEPRDIALPDGSGSIPQSSDVDRMLEQTRPDVVIDFSIAAWTTQVMLKLVAAGVRPVIGTTGHAPQFIEELSAACRARSLGGVVAANFAVGAVLMMHFAKIAAPFFDVAEIIELHHDKKIDSPSGTAVATARGMVEARGGPFTRPETEKFVLPGGRGAEEGGLTIHSVRLPGLVAHQEVIFGGLGQTLTIRHDTTSRESFIPGVLLAARAVMERTDFVVGLDRLMGLS